jgi:ADP-heptose:LPS heptosyltransferase
VKVVSINAAASRNEFQKLLDARALTPESAARLAQQAARSCLCSPPDLHSGALLLCELAMLENPDLARCGAEAIFRQVVEAMADAFDPEMCIRYIEFFARVLQFCRTSPRGRWLDERLRSLGLVTLEDLIGRAKALRQGRRRSADSSAVRKVLVLSRITLGADVAITSVVLQGMMRAFPQARLVFLANERAGLLFAGNTRVTARLIDYPRGGGLIERLAAWPAAAEAVREEIEGLTPEQYLIVDPDSRLTQLGMLPVAPDESRYRFFESRSFCRANLETLSELAGAWLQESFGVDAGPLRPWVSLPARATEFARAVKAALPPARWAAVNLGVGDNPAKRIEGDFERLLLARLLATGWRIFLDQGAGEEETARAQRLLADLRQAGWQTAEITEQDAVPCKAARVVAWRGSLAGFGALIGVSDVYVGYDSAGQHIAAALGVKTVDIFAGFRSPRMAQRWKPSGPAAVRMIVVDSSKTPETVLAEVLEAAQ